MEKQNEERDRAIDKGLMKRELDAARKQAAAARSTVEVLHTASGDIVCFVVNLSLATSSLFLAICSVRGRVASQQPALPVRWKMPFVAGRYIVGPLDTPFIHPPHRR